MSLQVPSKQSRKKVRPNFMNDNHTHRHYYILTCPAYIMVLECFKLPKILNAEKNILRPLMNHYVMVLYKILLSSKVTQGTETTEE